MKTINVRITDEQYAKIKASGLTIAEHTRRALDAFDVDYHEQTLLEILKYCSNKLEHKYNVKINKDDVKICKDDVKICKENGSENQNCKDNLYTNKDNLYTNKDILYKDKDNLYTNKEKESENTEENEDPSLETVAKILANDFSMLSDVLNNPINNDSVPDITIKMLQKKHNLSKKTIERFIYKWKKQLKEGNFQ